MPGPHNNRGARQRHAHGGVRTGRSTHGGSFDPTASQNGLYGGSMDLEPITSPEYQGPINGDQIDDGTIGSRHIAELAILSDALADNAVARRHLADHAVGTTEIEQGSITTDLIMALAITTELIQAGAITAEKINAAGISALQITSGTLRIGGLANTPDILDLFDDEGNLIARFDEDGMLMIDAADSNNRVRFLNGSLEFTVNGDLEGLATWGTAINGEGIRADSIKVGIAPGGHNLVPNSSFENSPFTTGLEHEWTTTADFAATIGTDVNVTAASDSLTLTTATF